MNKTEERPEEPLCHGISRLDEPCDLPGKRRCERCGLWFCGAHYPDPDWHPCAPEQGTG